MPPFPLIESLEPRRHFAATHVRIDVGASVPFVGTGGKTWQADRGGEGGTIVAGNFPVAGTTEDKLFQTYRTGAAFGYSLPVAKGNYRLRLYFVQPTTNPADVRTFHVSAERTRVLSTYKLATPQTAVSRTVNVTVRDGRLSLWFQGIKGTEAMVSAIELIPVSPLGLEWTQLAPTPLRRFEALSAAVNGKLYMFGGFHTSDIKTTTRGDAFDPATNTWTQVADVPELLSHAGVATDGPRIYFAGGFTGDWKGANTPITRIVRVYNTSTNSWSTIAPLPQARAAGALVRVGRKLHFFGGLDSFINDSGTHWELDLRTPTRWKTRAPMPNPRNHLGYTEYMGKVFAIGGQHRLDEHHGNDTAVHAYDPVANRWNAVVSLKMPRSHTHNSTFVWGGRITMIGGSTQEHTSLADLTQFDPKRNRWVTIGYLPAPRSATSSQLVSDQIITVGGTPTNIDPRAETYSLR